MKGNKTIGFDILDNIGLDKIDEIGTDIDMLDDKTKKRILDMTRRKFNAAIANGGAGITEFTDANSMGTEFVEKVEVYHKKKSTKIMMNIVNAAAAFGIVAGSVFFVKNIGRNDIDPLESSTPDLPAVSTTEGNDKNAQMEAARNARIEEYIEELFYAHYSYIYRNEDDYYKSLKVEYAYLDLNKDSIDELFIYHFNPDLPIYESTEICYFDGTKYVPVTDLFGQINDQFKFDLENCRLYSLVTENATMLITSTWADSELSKNNSDFFKIQDRYVSRIKSSEPLEFTYERNDSECTKEEYDNVMAEYENCNSASIEFIPYIVNKAQPTS